MRCAKNAVIFQLSIYLLMSFQLKSQVDSEDNNLYAVIVGISNYENVRDLNYAHQDALQFKKYINEVYTDAKLSILIDSTATRINILIELGNILSEVDTGDTVIFYFSGHGDCETRLIEEPGFLLSYDSPKNNYLISALRVSELKSFFESYIEKRGAKVMLFIDACRAGSLSKDNSLGPGKTASSLMNLFQNELLFLGCKPDQYSLERSQIQQGLFTYYLINGCRGAADTDGNNLLEVEELRRYLYDQVMDASQNSQTPMIFGDPLATIPMVSDTNRVLTAIYHSEPGRFSRPLERESSSFRSGELPQFNRSKLDSIDENKEQLLKLFNDAIQSGKLTAPKDSCAVCYYQQFPTSSKEKQKIKVRLIENLLKSSTECLLNYTKNRNIDDDVFSIPEESTSQAISHLEIGLSLLSPDDIYLQTFTNRLYFLKAYSERYRHNPDWQKAISLLDTAKIYESLGAYIYNELGEAYKKLDELEKAEIAYNSAMEVSPEWGIPINNQIEIEVWEAAREENTIAAYEKYLQKFPEGLFVTRAQVEMNRLGVGPALNVSGNSFSDRDGNTYAFKTMKDGKRWMTQNLNVEIQDSYCYDNKEGNCQKYGRLYTYEAAKEGCRLLGDGWRLPTENEWREMAKKYGGADDDFANGSKAAYNALFQNGSSGFAALLGGIRHAGSSYYALGKYGSYWASTEINSNEAWNYFFLNGKFRNDFGYQTASRSVRCLQD